MEVKMKAEIYRKRGIAHFRKKRIMIKLLLISMLQFTRGANDGTIFQTFREQHNLKKELMKKHFKI